MARKTIAIAQMKKCAEKEIAKKNNIKRNFKGIKVNSSAFGYYAK